MRDLFVSPRVFVSYAHEPQMNGHRTRALELAQSLRLRGVDAMIDQFVEHEGPHWPQWTQRNIRDAGFVLCLASPSYKQRVEAAGDPQVGLGARWEGAVITELLYAQIGPRCVAVVLEGCSPADIPDILLPIGHTYYQLPQDDEDLYRRLTNQPRALPAPLGEIVKLETRAS
jgi:TIR domain